MDEQQKKTAGFPYFICVVTGVGAYEFPTVVNPPPEYFLADVRLTDLGGSFTNRDFNFPEGARRAMIAVALAAISNQLHVNAACGVDANGIAVCAGIQISTL